MSPGDEVRFQVFKRAVIDVRPADCPYSIEQLEEAFKNAQSLINRNADAIRANGGEPCRLELWKMNITESIRTLVERGQQAFFEDYARHLNRPDEEWLHNRPYVHNMLRIMQSLGLEEPEHLRTRRTELARSYAEFQRSVRDEPQDRSR